MRIKTLPIMMTVLLTVAFGLVLGAFAEDAEYVGQKQCKMCHNKKDEGEQWNIWKAMKHAQAYEALLSDQAKEVAAKLGLDKAPSEAVECLRCHVTGYDAEAKTVPAKIAAEDGIQCESCHGPSSLHLPDGKALKFSKEDTDIDVSAHINRPGEERCVQCHNDQNPTWDPERYTKEDGSKAGFDFKQAFETIAHMNPKKAE